MPIPELSVKAFILPPRRVIAVRQPPSHTLPDIIDADVTDTTLR